MENRTKLFALLDRLRSREVFLKNPATQGWIVSVSIFMEIMKSLHTSLRRREKFRSRWEEIAILQDLQDQRLSGQLHPKVI